MIEIIMHPNVKTGNIDFKIKSDDGIYGGTFEFNPAYLPGIAITLDKKEVKKIRNLLKKIVKPV